jgi:hypothetical protein
MKRAVVQASIRSSVQIPVPLKREKQTNKKHHHHHFPEWPHYISK